MATTYILKSINDTKVVVTINGGDVDVPVLASAYAFDDTNMTEAEITVAQAEAEVAFLDAIGAYVNAYVRGQQTAQPKTTPLYLIALVGDSFVTE